MIPRQRITCIGTGLCVLVLAAVVAPLLAQGKKEQSDSEKLQGKWLLVTVEQNGSSDTYEELKGFGIFLEIKDDKFGLTNTGTVKGTIKLDPKASPKTIDFVYEGNKDVTLSGQVRLGIYEIDGDTLRICCTTLYTKDTPRPKQFKTTKAKSKDDRDNIRVETYKRVK